MDAMKNDNRKQADLAGFYAEWSSKSADAIDFDIRSAERKASAIVQRLPPAVLDSLRRLIDFGCGYGAVLLSLKRLRAAHIEAALGLDFSDAAIDVARQRNNCAEIRYEKLPAFDIRENRDFLRTQLIESVDAILLIDLLEHVPDCRTLIAELAPHTRWFLIKLPVESSLMDNYLLPKEYPSSVHSNGHLREFDANSVYYFIRSLGLTPIFETLYRYESEDSFPPVAPDTSWKGRLFRFAIKIVKTLLSWILPTKLFLRVAGGGGYICVASYHPGHLLNP